MTALFIKSIFWKKSRPVQILVFHLDETQQFETYRKVLAFSELMSVLDTPLASFSCQPRFFLIFKKGPFKNYHDTKIDGLRAFNFTVRSLRELYGFEEVSSQKALKASITPVSESRLL